MAMVVKNNMSAISTLNTLNKNQSALKSSLEKVSSGMKINSAQDDASGYAISERMRAMIRSLDQANENTQNGNSLMKVAEGAVGNTVEILDTLKKKAIQAATDTNTDDDRATIQKEIDQLIDQVDENALVTYNGKYLLDGSRTQAGAATHTAMTNQKLDVGTDGMTKLVDLKNRKGESLEIIATDQVQASYVMNGKTYTTTFAVGNNSLRDIFYSLNDLTDSMVFGPANLEDNELSLADGKNVLAANAIGTTNGANNTTTGKTIIDILNGTTTDTTTVNKYVNAAAALARDEDGVGVGKNAYVQSLKAATTDLDNALDIYFGKIEMEASAALASASIGLQFNIFQADGSVRAKTYEFSKDGVTTSAVTLKDMMSSDDFKELKSDLINSIYNLARAGTSSTDTDLNDPTNAAAAFVYSSSATAADFSSATVGGAAISGGASGDLYKALTNSLGFLVKNVSAVNESSAATADIKIALNQKVKDATTTNTILAQTTVIANGTAAGGSGSATPTTGNVFDLGGVTLATASIDAAGTNEYDSLAAGSDGDTSKSVLVSAAPGGTVFGITAIDNYATAFLTSRLAMPIHSGTDIGLDPSKAMVKTADGTIGLTVTAMNSGINKQISGLTIKIMDAQAQSRTAINEVLDSFGTTIFASSKSDDLTLKFHTGAEAGQALSVGLSDMRSSALGLKGNDSEKVSVATQEKANAAISVFNNALQKALDIQTTIGAIEARLNYTSSNLTTATENITASESTIRDADMAKEMTEYTKNNVLLQAAQSMLAQANQNSSAVLSLLQ